MNENHRIEPRDVAIFEELATARYHTMKTLAAALDRSIKSRSSRFEARLLQLRKLGYLGVTHYGEHVSHGIVGSTNALEYLDLDPKEEKHLANIARNGRDRTAKNLRHELMLSRLRAHFLVLERAGAFTITQWIAGWHFTLEWEIDNVEDALKPDVFVQIEKNGKRYNFFVEADTSSYPRHRTHPEQGREMWTKLLRYEVCAEYPEEVPMLGELGVRLFRLIILRKETRAKNKEWQTGKAFDTIRRLVDDDETKGVCKIIRFLDESWLEYGKPIIMENAAGGRVTLFD